MFFILKFIYGFREKRYSLYLEIGFEVVYCINIHGIIFILIKVFRLVLMCLPWICKSDLKSVMNLDIKNCSLQFD